MNTMSVLRSRLQPVAVVALTAVWLLLWGSLTWGNVVFGLLLAIVVLLVFPLPTLTLGVRIRPVASLVLAARFAVDLVVASVQMAYRAVAPWWHPEDRLVRVQLRTDNDFVATVTAQMVGLVPGTVVIDVDTQRHDVLVHVFHAPTQADLDDVCRSVHAQEARVLAALAPDRRCVAPRSRPDDASPGGRS